MKTIISKILFASTFLSLLISCDTKKKAIGNNDEIFVIADTSEYYQLEPVLVETFEKIIYTPQPENLFSLNRNNFENLQKIKNRKNIIIIAPLNSESQTSKYIRKNLDKNVRSLVESDSVFVFNKYDLWAKDQIVMFLTSPSIEKLKNNILLNKESLLYYFQKMSNQRLSESLYSKVYEKKDTEARLLNNYDWTIYVQADFLLAKESREDNFIWLRRAVNSDMERWIFVCWLDNATPDLLNYDSLYSLRNKTTEKFYRTSDEKTFVEISKAPFEPNITEVNFNKKYAMFMQGFWKFKDNSGGGPFLSYSFFDPKSKRLYMIDGSVYAPKYFKKNLIQQLDVLLQSFRMKNELTKERIEDLESELD
jgi:hypothetical protein